MRYLLTSIKTYVNPFLSTYSPWTKKEYFTNQSFYASESRILQRHQYAAVLRQTIWNKEFSSVCICITCNGLYFWEFQKEKQNIRYLNSMLTLDTNVRNTLFLYQIFIFYRLWGKIYYRINKFEECGWPLRHGRNEYISDCDDHLSRCIFQRSNGVFCDVTREILQE